MRLKTLVVLTMLCGLVPATAHVIYDNGGPNTDLLGVISDLQQGVVAADDFVLQPGASVVRDVHWWGGYDPEQFDDDNFTVVILGDDGGLPGNLFLLLTGTITRSETGLTNAGGFDIYAYDMVLDSEVALTPNTSYWLAIVNDTDGWFWQASNRDGSHLEGVVDGDIDAFPHDLAFNLTNDPIVPEPASMALFGIGLAGLALRRRK